MQFFFGSYTFTTYLFIPTGGVIAPVYSSFVMITPNLSDVNYFPLDRDTIGCPFN